MKFILICLFILTLLPLGLTQNILCSTCENIIGITRFLFQMIIPSSIVKQSIAIICDRQYSAYAVCQQIADNITPIAIEAFIKGFLFNKNYICYKFCQKLIPLKIQEEVSRILSGKQAFSSLQMLPFNTFNISIQKQTKYLKILQISDIHLDLKYVENSTIICSLPICCRQLTLDSQYKAKPFGSSTCDTPLKLFRSAIQSLKGKQIDLVIVTGDYSAHNQWQKQHKSNYELLDFVDRQIKQIANIQHLIRVQGNNDYFPDHQVPNRLNPQNLIKLYDIYYNNKILSFVALNTVICDNLNLDLIRSTNYQVKQLASLEFILKNKDNVYILGHLAPSTSACSTQYSIIFRSLVTKYSHKIKGQFYGHSHIDQFIIYTDVRDQKQVGFGLSIGSLSPLGLGLSRYRIYTIGQQLYDYDDYQNDNFDDPKWKLSYSFRTYYNVPISTSFIEFLYFMKAQFQNPQSMLKSKYIAKTKPPPIPQFIECRIYDIFENRKICQNNITNFRHRLLIYIQKFHANWSYLVK